MRTLIEQAPGLARSLQLAHAAERAASFAYIGHAAALKSEAERAPIREIEADEWEHRREVKKIMDYYGISPNRYLEAKYYLIGKCIGWSCFLLGRFMPYFFAGRLESGNVCEYIVMLRRFRELGITEHDEVLYEMGVREKAHEVYFQEVIEGEPWLSFFEKVFNWGADSSRNDLDYDELLPVGEADYYCKKYRR
ncbi:MAG: ferritin-like domain-containing protein [Opitutales bacterium]